MGKEKGGGVTVGKEKGEVICDGGEGEGGGVTVGKEKGEVICDSGEGGGGRCDGGEGEGGRCVCVTVGKEKVCVYMCQTRVGMVPVLNYFIYCKSHILWSCHINFGRDQNRSGGTKFDSKIGPTQTNFASNFGPCRANMILCMRHRCFGALPSPSPSPLALAQSGWDQI